MENFLRDFVCIGLLERAKSCSRNISLAISGDDITIVVILPSLRDIMGP